MIARFIEACYRNRFLVLVIWTLILIWGLYATYNLPIDAIPDLSDVQVIIRTEFAEQAPQVVEDQVTYPLTTTMLAVPRSKVVRGYSQFGLSLVYVIFEDGTDIYWARSRVLEYLNYVRGRLPEGVNPALGPDATGVGWVYIYTLEDTTGKHDLAHLRTIQDWYLRYQVQRVPGVAEVASIGGFVKQYQVLVDPNKLAAYNLPLSKLKDAIRMSNQDVGGRVIEMAETEYMVRGLGYIQNLEDVEDIAVGTDKGTPIRIKDVAEVRLGPDMRRGLAEANGKGEVVGGVVVMRFGENARAVIDRVKVKLEELKAGLPEGVRLVTAYDRSGLIERCVDTLKEALTEELIIVSLMCGLFLYHFRSSIVAFISLPLGILISFILQHQLNITANILSLSGLALAIGDMVDAAVIMVEDAHKRLHAAGPEADRESIILKVAQEVGPSLFFSLMVITVSFLPIFALTGESGRLFRPLAFTKTFAMAGASILAITLIPVLMYYFVWGKIRPEEKIPLVRWSTAVYRPILHTTCRNPKAAILIAVSLLLISLYPLLKLGTEFMPPLDEGDLLYMPTSMPGIGVTEAKAVLQQTDRIIYTFPEVEYVFGKAGRAETATDPAPLNMIETTIKLKDPSQWRPGYDTQRLIRELDAAVKFPGLANTWGFPIRVRIDMLSTGIRSPVGLKILGPDLGVLNTLAENAENIFRTVPGTASVYGERTTGGYYLDFKINRKEAGRYGLTVGEVQDVILSALGGMTITQTVEGLERYPVNLRYFQDYRDNLPALNRVLIPTPTGAQVPMGQLAAIDIHQGPDMIKSEDARRTSWIYVDIRDIDLGTYIARAKEAIKTRLQLPPGYTLTWSGQFEYLERAKERLLVVVPVTMALVFLLLFFESGSVVQLTIILLSLPFSIMGGLWLCYLLGYNISIGVVVGFIAMAGVDVETGVIMLLFLNMAYEEGIREGRMNTLEDLRNAVMDGALSRLRPVLMTSMANLFGLLPIMVSVGAGAEVAKRFAAPMVGGVFSSLMLELLIYPAVFITWKWHFEMKKKI
ncbi:MAG: CusA/CzcA family heavy metal efflux RND transporter [Desulfobaccales bacterium]